ncbi:MAG: flavodoxin family protein [Phascolarctobacterium sp.]
MSKNVLILAGSPRKGGNSDILCDAFKQGAEEAGHKVEKIWLQSKKINYCFACYACKTTGQCFQKDDANEIIAKMLAADVIVLATPVYFYSMSGQMKTLIDRSVSKWTETNNKEFYFIATAAEDKPSMERTMEALAGFTDCLTGAVVKGKIYGECAYEKGEVKNTPAIEEAYKIGLSV